MSRGARCLATVQAPVLRSEDVRRGPHENRPLRCSASERVPRRLTPPAVLVAVGLLAACDRGPSDAQLDQWLEEAREADREAMARHGDDDERARWTLTVVNPIAESTELRWRELDRMAGTTVDTDLPPEGDVHRHASFRVVTLAQLLERADGPRARDDVTLVAYDGFRATIDVADLAAHPIGLAVEADGRPIDRASGGPLFTVFPISETPALLQRYSSSWWVFYVTHILIDTPPPRVNIVDRRPNRDPTPHSVYASVLTSLPRNRLTMSVGYRTGWPSEPVVLEGVLLRELLETRDILLEPGDEIRVNAIAPLTRGDSRPTVLSADEVMLRPTMLAMRWAPEGSTGGAETTVDIPARLGGPLTLAVPSEVQQRLGDRVWLTHVDEIVVQHVDPAASDAAVAPSEAPTPGVAPDAVEDGS